MVSHFCCLSPACTSITGPVFIICWTSNVIVIKLPNGALSTEILHFTCGVSCCLDFCLTATFLQHSPQAGSQHIPAWAFNSIIVCASLWELLFFNILSRSLCRLTSQLHSHLLPAASLLQGECTEASVLSIYSPKLKQNSPKPPEKRKKRG